MTGGVLKSFTSTKPGIAGKREVLKRAREYEDGKRVDLRSLPLNKVWPQFLDRIIDRKGKGESYIQNETYGRLYILPVLGKRKVSNITLDDWQSVISTARPQGKTRKDGSRYFQTLKLSKKTISNLRNAIMMFIKYAVERDYMDPLRGALYVPDTAPTVGKEILQPEHIKRLFEPSDDWYIDALRFMAVTGLRPGEVFGLKIADYHDGMITIRRARNYRGQETTGKTKNAQREIVLHEIAKGVAETAVKKAQNLHSVYMFCNRIGEPGAQRGAYSAWKRIAAARDLPGTPYSLRHTFISMVKNDLPEQMIKAIVGHSVSMDTFGVYGHKVDGDMAKAAKIMDITFGRKLS
jgi:integrase